MQMALAVPAIAALHVGARLRESAAGHGTCVKFDAGLSTEMGHGDRPRDSAVHKK